jgi:hypothetical protein
MDLSYDKPAIQALYQQKIDGWNAGNEKHLPHLILM